MMQDETVMYRGAKIFRGPDHRGRKQLWVSIPSQSGNARFACHSVEDGKAAIDAHLDGYSPAVSNRWTAVGAAVAGVVLLVVLFGLGLE